MWQYRAALVRTVDGDSIVALLDLGCSVRVEVELRLLGVYAPEHDQPGGLETRDFVTAWFGQLSVLSRWPVLVTTSPTTTSEPTERRSFVRYIATVREIGAGGRSLNADVATFLAQHPEWGHGIT